MRAALLLRPGRMETVADHPEPEPGAGELVVRVAAVGLCGTDLGYWEGSRVPDAYPAVLGHEGYGTVVAVGEGVDSARIGERVAIEPNFPCGACEPCRAGLTALCRDRGSLALTLPGLLADRVAVPSRYAWRLPDAVSARDAVCVEPLAVVASAIRRSGLAPGTGPVLVVGAGPQGLLLVEVLRSRGSEVAVVEPQEHRLALALELGARRAEEGENFAFAFEASGSGPGGRALVEALGPGGTGVLIGVGPTPVPVDNRLMVRNGLTLVGSMTYDHPGDFAATIALLESGEVRPGRILAPGVPLEQSHEAFAAARTSAGKTWITLDHGRNPA